MSRLDDLIAKYENKLMNEGIVRRKVRNHSLNNLTEHDTFMDYMIDVRLSGREDLTPQEIWETMKSYCNSYKSDLNKAADEYRKLQNKYRHLLQDYENILKEITDETTI